MHMCSKVCHLSRHVRPENPASLFPHLFMRSFPSLREAPLLCIKLVSRLCSVRSCTRSHREPLLCAVADGNLPHMPSAPTIGASIPAASPASAAAVQAMDTAAIDTTAANGVAGAEIGGLLQQAFQQQQQQQHSLEQPGSNGREDSISLPDIPTANPPQVCRNTDV